MNENNNGGTECSQMNTAKVTGIKVTVTKDDGTMLEKNLSYGIISGLTNKSDDGVEICYMEVGKATISDRIDILKHILKEADPATMLIAMTSLSGGLHGDSE